MTKSTKYTDEHAIAAWFIEHLDLTEDTEIEVIQYGREMYNIIIGNMSNPRETRAVSAAMNTLFMTDDEIEEDFQKIADHLRPSLLGRGMVHEPSADDIFIKEAQDKGLSPEFMLRFGQLISLSA